MGKTRKKKLVLFDIDGTLIRPLKPGRALRRFAHAIWKVYGVKNRVIAKHWKYNGMCDRAILWDLVHDKGVTREQFLERLPEVMDLFCDFLTRLAQSGPVYQAIPAAKRLVEKTLAASYLHLGLLTGNLEPSAHWKLHHAGFTGHFDFGVYGHEADYRNDLAKLAVVKAKARYGREFPQRDIIVIGDTVHDIRCGKVIGASTVAVTTGWKEKAAPLLAESPDLLVDSLMDERVLTLLGLS